MDKFKIFELEQIKQQVSSQWENQLNVQRGNPTRTFKGSDFKKEKVVKTYKSERQQLKQQLNQYDN